MTLDDRIRIAASDYLGWGYSSTPARVARRGASWVPESVVREPVEPPATDCCTFAAGVLGVALPGAWPADAWGQMMIRSLARPWSTVECPVAAGVAVAATEPLPGRWYLVQGWSGLRLGQVVPGASSGHTWLQWGPSTILEASSAVQRVRWTSRPWADTLRRYDEVRLVELREAS